MSAFTGRQFKGAMRARRAELREQAESRNAAAHAKRRPDCGHVHGVTALCATRVAFFSGHGVASSNDFNKRYDCPCGLSIVAPLDDPEFMSEVMEHETEHSERLHAVAS